MQNMDQANRIKVSRPGSRMARALHERGANAVADGGVPGEPRSGAVPRARNRTVVDEVQDLTPASVSCEHCGREFNSTRGLGVHVRRAHPVEANDAIDVERVKARWSVEEVRLMARTEATATLDGGVFFMNQYLHDKFPHRSLEAIKGKRRQDSYRAIVRECLRDADVHGDDRNGAGEAMNNEAAEQPESIESEPEVVNSEAPMPLPHQNDERLRSKIRELIQLTSSLRSYEAGVLVDIASTSLTAGRVDVRSIERWLVSIFPRRPTAQPPQRRKQREHRKPPPQTTENREQRRKREYAHVQSLYKKSRKACLSFILQGGSERQRPSNVAFAEYWRPLMEASSEATGQMDGLRQAYLKGVQRHEVARTEQSAPRARGIHLEGLGNGETADDNVPTTPDKATLWDPISVSEINRIQVQSGTAPGLDGVTARQWKMVPDILRALLFNLLLLAREAPSSITDTRTVFLEKGGMPEVPEPSDYRPLSIGSVVLRHLHKILAFRLTALNLSDERQRGFKPVDGVCENVTIISALLSDARRSRRTMHLACVDVSKAFDTVSHEAIHQALLELDLPIGFREYIRAVYANARTVFWPPNEMMSMTQLGRGVRQGDPLSPLLFNLVVDRALGILSEDVGYKLGNRAVNALGYADDIVLLASTRVGMQENLSRLHAAFQCHGLTINAKKTGVLSLVASGRDKKVKVDMTPAFVVGGALIRQRSPVEVWTYLGNTYQGAREFATIPPLAHTTELISKAPLKPQQRLTLLRDYLLPRLYHRWIVGSVTSRTLKSADIVVRTSVRRWLRLPHDAPVGYFHAPIQKGGLGLPYLNTLIPILKHTRLQRLCKSTLPVARAAAESTYVARQLVWCDNQMRIRGNRVTTTAELRQQCSDLLHGSCDGSGLREAQSSKLSSYWVSEDAAAIPGADYVHYHHVRANCLPSRARVSRGRDERETRCRAGCPERETPAHCVQRCFRTHGGRILRHDDLCRRVGGFLEQKGWQVERELAYPTSAGRRRPDMTIRRGGVAVVLDAQVVSSETALDVSHRRKVEKYRSNNDLADRVAEHTGATRNNVRFTALTISWRGVWSPASENEMVRLGLTARQLRTLTTRVLWGSWLNWKRFNSITTRYRRPAEQAQIADARCVPPRAPPSG